MLSEQDPKVVGCWWTEGFHDNKNFMIVWFINYLTWQNN